MLCRGRLGPQEAFTELQAKLEEMGPSRCEPRVLQQRDPGTDKGEDDEVRGNYLKERCLAHV